MLPFNLAQVHADILGEIYLCLLQLIDLNHGQAHLLRADDLRLLIISWDPQGALGQSALKMYRPPMP